MSTGLSKTMFEQLRSDLEYLLSTTDEYVTRAEQAGDSDEAKLWIRRAHEGQRKERLEDARSFIAQHEDEVLDAFADGRDVDPHTIDPVISPVITSHDNNLWRYASLTWSVPVSQGYGRRSKFLVRDRSNNKLIAIFALGDPVIGLQVRDNAIGWTVQQRHKRLYNVYDAFVLGAVDPYRQLLGGKLVALLAISNEARRYLTNKYSGTTTVITGESKDPTPVLITTSSALGRSSVYNRIKYYDHRAFFSVGYTRGFGHFHISEEMFEQLVLFTQAQGKTEEASFGKGANYRFRVIRSALKELGLPSDGLKHGIQREVFLAPVAHNWKEYLRGETDHIRSIDMPADDISEFYRQRWAIPRAARTPDYQRWDRTAMRLSNQIAGVAVQYSLMSTLRDRPTSSAQTDNGRQFGPVRVSVVEETSSSVVSSVEVDGVTMRLTDDVGPDGSRHVSCIALEKGASHLEELMGKRFVVEFRPSPLQENLVWAEIRPAVMSTSGRLGQRKLTRSKAEAAIGAPLSDVLPRSAGAIIGTKAELFRDEGRSRSDVCVMVPSDSAHARSAAWAVTRLLPAVAAHIDVQQDADGA